VLDQALRDLDLGLADLELAPVASFGSGCTLNSALKLQSASVDVGNSKSNCGSETGRRRFSPAASRNQPPMWVSTASA